MLPLENVKILDLTKALSGPFAVMNLADLGADVIKVENPDTGDDCRCMGPFVNGESGYYMSVNRNKRGIALNLKSPEAAEIFWKLIDWADVVTENFKPGTMEKFGFGYSEIKKRKPDIIYAACSGFGHTGPYRYKPAFDVIVQAAGGIMSVTGPEGGPATRVGVSLGDLSAGLYMTIGILTALYQKKTSGIGQKLDVAMLDCQVALLENAIIKYTSEGIVASPKGNRHPSCTPFEPFLCGDGKEIVIAVGTDRIWERFCDAASRTNLLSDPKLATNDLRTQNYPYCKTIMDAIMREKTSDEWMSVLEKHTVPVTTLNTIDQVVNDPQVIARNMIIETVHPTAGRIRTAGNPINLSACEAKPNRPAPVLGQDTADVLKNMLHYTDEQIQSLCNAHIV